MNFCSTMEIDEITVKKVWYPKRIKIKKCLGPKN